MTIKPVRQYNLGMSVSQVRSANVDLGQGKKGMLFVYSASPGVDPGEEYVTVPPEKLKVAVFTVEGERLWERTLSEGVIPGVWFCPVIPFDLDGDGVDEIYLIENNSKAPFSLSHRRLRRLDGLTGEVTGDWPWPRYTENEPLSHCYRWYLVGGYVHGEPVLVCSQGTYGDMFLQGYNKGMEKRWEIKIKEEDPGPRTSHVTPVWDYNSDGIDELFWGERILSLDDGHEIVCCDPKYHGHSDVVIPFENYKDGKYYLFTCREDHETEGENRVQIFNMDGTVAWNAIPSGHMHKAWLANIGDNYEKTAMSMRVDWRPTATGYEHAYDGEFYFDAYTGDPVEWKLPIRGSDLIPLDINGDGYHEFIAINGTRKGDIIDRHGKLLGQVEGAIVRDGKMLDLPGEQFMLHRDKASYVEIYHDSAAVDSPMLLHRHNSGYHRYMLKLTASGYNSGTAVTCAI